MKDDHRITIANLTTILLVLVIPVMVGFLWLERQRTDDLRALQAAAAAHQLSDSWAIYDALMASCERGNVLRAHLNVQLVDCAVAVPKPDEARPKKGAS